MSHHLSITTFNVLHNNSLLVKPITQGPKRFQSTAQQILSSPSDIYCTNQTTLDLLQVLQPLIIDKYPYHSPFTQGRRGHCVMIFSKWPMENLSCEESTVIVRVDLGEKTSVVVVAEHLSAEETKVAVREEEMRVIMGKLRGLGEGAAEKTREAIRQGNVILLGDLNLHLINETCMLYRHGFYDCWVERHPFEQGYTWDSQKNKLINYLLPYDNRRMRLDRIAVKNGSQLKLEDIRIINDEILEDTKYLFKSDHFGLEARFALTDESVTVDHSQHLQRIKHQNSTGFRTIRQIACLRLLTISGLGLLTYALIP